MVCVEEKISNGRTNTSSNSTILMEEMKLLKEMQDQSVARKAINSELWHACAGPLASLPNVGSLVYYFPQGHSEQVAVSTKRSATSQIPNYPNLPSQLMCQVHNVTMHADKDTDEVFAQMSLQPVNSDKDIFPIPDFGMKQNKHPTEFFCKTLTASDTSTHGGFSVPRRAAEKLFPQLDYSVQPPTQELVVRDLHENTWTFRHIYRGQPKRHLLTTGWSLFVGAKRLKAGDSVLFIRDEKSQLMVGVRRANRQQATMPSSVLSADSMHIGVLAAAAHAAANRSPFTIFFNPRACPSEFVVPMAKFRKAVYGTQISSGMRFGMMFETEESGKRRYMGTIVGVSDVDPLRWPGSKWRNLQVEWDEAGCSDKQNRVNSWEIETPESLFIFPSLTSGLKRPIYPGFLGTDSEWGNLIKRPYVHVPDNGISSYSYPSASNISSEQMMKMLYNKPQVLNYPPAATFSPSLQDMAFREAQFQEAKAMQVMNKQTPHHVQPIENRPPLQINQQVQACTDQFNGKTSSLSTQNDPIEKSVDKSHSAMKVENSKSESSFAPHQASQAVTSNPGQTNEAHREKIITQNHNSPCQTNAWIAPTQVESSFVDHQQFDASQLEANALNVGLPFLDNDDWMNCNSTYQSLAGVLRSPGPLAVYGLHDSSVVFPEPINPLLPSFGQEIWDHQVNNYRCLTQPDQLASFPQQDLKDLSDESNNQSGIYNTLVDPSVSSAILNDFGGTLKDTNFKNSSECLVGNFTSSQDVQSQITSTSLAATDPRIFSRQDNSGGTSSSNVEFDEGNNLLRSTSWKQVTPCPPMRTYTKVQKAGSVGRSIDVMSYKNYEELCKGIERMFGLEGLLNDPRGSGWKLVYVDYENDVLLVGDDPWEEFIGCVRCIRILSPSEVEQMSAEGMQILNSTAMQGLNAEVSQVWNNAS